MFKKKVEPNDSLIHIFDYINNNPDRITWKELIQMSIDYDCYRELYLNHIIINHLVGEHNEEHEQNKVKNESAAIENLL